MGGVGVAAVMILLLSVQPRWMGETAQRGMAYLDPQVYPGAMAFFGADVPDGVEPLPADNLGGGDYGWPIGDHSFYPADFPSTSPTSARYPQFPCCGPSSNRSSVIYFPLFMRFMASPKSRLSRSIFSMPFGIA
ncbi:hypothetical protein [Corynebacterium pilosum]|nr:hypothetical protein [Corynebacterium pilosum]